MYVQLNVLLLRVKISKKKFHVQMLIKIFITQDAENFHIFVNNTI